MFSKTRKSFITSGSLDKTIEFQKFLNLGTLNMNKEKSIQQNSDFSQKMEKILEPLSTTYAIDNFFYTELLPKKQQAFFLSNKFSTLENIIKIGEFSNDHDKFLTHIDHNYHKFIWPENASDKIGTMLQATGIKSGISLLYRVGDSIRNIGFASTTQSNILTALILNKEELFHHFIKYFECEAENILQDKLKYLVDFKISYTNENYDLKNNEMETCIESMKINKIFLSSSNKEDSVYLTKREWECLFFLCKGKSIKQISHKLNLSARTVESYLQSCKIKFSAHNKFELIEKAMKIEIDKLCIVDEKNF
jgi:DNA-binding CsgD family transcriptional regulator